MGVKTMTLRKSDNDADTEADFLTFDAVAKYLSISRMSLYNLINNEEIIFPKSFSVTKAEKRKKRLWDKEEVKDWVKSQRNEKVT
jgi:excisionase family DNA binding protein